MITRSQIKFHETFQPELSYISKILELGKNNFKGTKYDISDLTGIPTGKQKGKVEPHIKYATYMGLIDHVYDGKNYSLSLTRVGEEVFVQDPYLHETITHWLCHYFITSHHSQAFQWSYLIKHAYRGFFQSCSNNFLIDEANLQFQTNCTFEEMFGPIKRSYIDGAFSDLDYLDWNQDLKFLEQTENPEYVFLYAFILLDLWESVFPNRKELTFDEISNELLYNRFLGLNVEDCNSVLDCLSDESIISINRQLVPSTFMKLQHAADVLPFLYSRLL